MNDITKHIGAGLLVALLVGLPAYLNSGDLFAGVWASLTSGVIAGGIKEWCDNTYEWEWSWRDLGYTCLGAVVAVVFILLLHFGKG